MSALEKPAAGVVLTSGVAVTTKPIATCFISYNHADRPFASAIATGLSERGYRVWIDEGELRIGDSLVEAISTAIDHVDFLVALVSEASVGSSWCQKELSLAMSGEINRKGITVLPCRLGEATMPPSLRDKLYLRLAVDQVPSAVDELDRSMRRHLAPAQPMPSRRRTTASTPTARGLARAGYSATEPVRMIGIDANSMTSPRLDGTAGSALYMVPITLDVTPDQTWGELFVRHWDSPARWTSMHRPGIASVSGSRIRLDGTTVEEVERHHVETLKLAVEATNRDRAAIEERDARERARIAADAETHRLAAEEAAARIKFD